MSGPENILARWSRRKLGSAKGRAASSAGPSPEPNAAEMGRTGTKAAAPSDIDEPAAQAFDPASLPPIESIAAGTDIRSFLQSGVPAELTRSALRRAWVTDPAIRDFIGIAENQWDFNDPTAIPGFGPLRATDEVVRLAAQVLGRADDALGRIAQAYASSPPEEIEEKATAEEHDAPV